MTIPVLGSIINVTVTAHYKFDKTLEIAVGILNFPYKINRSVISNIGSHYHSCSREETELFSFRLLSLLCEFLFNLSVT